VLVEGIDPETRQIGNFEGKVAFQRFFVNLALAVVHDVIDHAMDILVLHRRQVDAPDVAMHANHGRQTGRQVKVGCLVLDAESQQFGDVHADRPRRACILRLLLIPNGL
jgi:hypothetical protein